MSEIKPSVLQISSSDTGGGAELTAYALFMRLKLSGYGSFLAVGNKHSQQTAILEIDNDRHRNAWVRLWGSTIAWYDNQALKLPAVGRLLRSIQGLGELKRWWRIWQGYEDFEFPGSLTTTTKALNDVNIVHCHNLHGNYFDLRHITQINRTHPIVISLHDAWLLSGHCAFSMGCERWQSACGACPDLGLYPSINKDRTSENLTLKKAIFNQIKCHLVAPSNWLLAQAKQSHLKDSIASARVIPGAVDTHVFVPKDKQQSRLKLGLDVNSQILMIAATGLVDNPWKDFRTLVDALTQLSLEVPITVLAVGSDKDDQSFENVCIKHVPYVSDPNKLADYYSASDIYVHCARVEVFGNVMLEARACGTPVIASAVGGIPEHIKGLDMTLETVREFDQYKFDQAPEAIGNYHSSEADGILCEPRNSSAVAKAIRLLLENHQLREQLGRNGLRNVTENFTLEHQFERYLTAYKSILTDFDDHI